MIAARLANVGRCFVDRLRIRLGTRSKRIASTLDPSGLSFSREAEASTSILPLFLGRISHLLIRFGDPADAFRLARLALRVVPGEASLWDSLANATAEIRTSGDCQGIRLESPVETDARRIALSLAPTEYRRIALGKSLVRDGDFDDAEAAFSSAAVGDCAASATYELGRLEAKRASRSGGFSQHGFERHHRSMQAVLCLDPTHLHARYHLLRVAFRAGQWDLAFETALAECPATPNLVAATEALLTCATKTEIIDALASLDPSSVPPNWWLTAHWRLLQLGLAPAAYQIKDRYAESLAPNGPEVVPYPSVRQVMLYIQVASSLGQAAAGLDAIKNWSRRRQRGTVDLILRQLARDLRLELGDFDEWRRYGLDGADRRFHRLIRGRSVAIVGPTDSSASVGDEIDAHDLVIRTKFTEETQLDHERQGSRTDIAYFADRAFALLWPSIEQTLANKSLSMAVVRPSATQSMVNGGHPGIRVQSAEIGSLLEASQFAIQRILYDIAPARPASVNVYNVDLFTSPVPYAPSYNIDERPLRDRGLLANIEGYGHDLRADHRFAKAARSSGFMVTDRKLNEILDLDTRGYLESVDHMRGIG